MASSKQRRYVAARSLVADRVCRGEWQLCRMSRSSLGMWKQGLGGGGGATSACDMLSRDAVRDVSTRPCP